LTRSRCTLVFGLLGFALLGVPRRARADDQTHACIVASEEGQQLRAQRKLVTASEKFAQCVRDVCPGAVRKACLAWRAEVETAIPSIVLAARDAAGRDLSAVKVSIDGSATAEQLDGRTLPVDPGPHLVRFEPANGEPLEERIIVRQGEKNRVIQVVIGPPSMSTAPTPRSGPAGVPLAAWVLGGVGVVALGSFAVFGLVGQSDRNSLEHSCVPTETCNPSAVTSMRTNLIVADVSLGVGIASAGGAVYFALARRSADTPVASVPLDFVASPGGGLLRWRGGF
jgi:hypothetical protein